MAILDFTTDEIATTQTALFAYKLETEGYLRSFERDDGHDDCCPKARARRATREQERASLLFRLSLINTVLNKF